MKIELKKVEHLERCSEETNCYAAQVWVDGKHICDVSNDGHGGCDNQHPAKGYTYADIEALNARIKKEFPPAFFIEGNPHPADLETVCGDLLTDHLIGKDLKRALAKELLFTTASQPGIRSIKLRQKGRKYAADEVASFARKRYADATILNFLPLPDALAIWKRDGRPA